MEGDVRKPEDAKRIVESTYQHFGRIDILINAAAGNFLSAAEDLSTNGFRTGGSTFSHSSHSYLFCQLLTFFFFFCYKKNVTLRFQCKLYLFSSENF